MNSKLLTATVWANDIHAASIQRTRQATVFSYEADYLASDLPAIATTLPKTEQPIVMPPGQLPAFFVGLLPEGRRLSALKRSVKTSADDDLSLLLAVGGNTVGNISILPEGQEPRTEPSFIDLDSPELDFAKVLESEGIGDPHALAGVQEKASARTIAVPMASEAILKVSPPEFPGLVENEYACLQAFRAMPAAKERVVNATIMHDKNGVPGLIVERFDGVFPNKYPVEDGAQLLGIYPADKYNVTFEELSKQVLSVVASPALAARGLALQLAFAWLSGNGDLHAKNISVMNTGKGFELAPVYDIPSTVPYGDTSLALEVAGSTVGLSRKKFMAVSRELGLSEKMSNAVAEQALTATAGLGAVLIDACAFDPRRARDLERTLKSRRQHW